MSRPILDDFNGFEKERDLIGQMLVAYGEIEFAVLTCVAAALDGETITAIQVLFRVRGEGARLEVADAIVRPAFKKHALEGKWGNGLGAARVCKDIRNQFAHCHWDGRKTSGLAFVNLDADAQRVSDPSTVTFIPIHLDLLKRQFAYFQYAFDLLLFLSQEYDLRVGKSSSHPYAEPKSIPRPPLDSTKD
jgi:hypothetical protein